MCSNMFKLFQNLFKCHQSCSNGFKLVKNLSNVFKWVQIVQNLFKCYHKCSNGFKLVQNLLKWVQMCSNGFKTCSNVSNVFQPVQNLFKCVQNCSKIIRFSSAWGPTWQAELDLVLEWHIWWWLSPILEIAGEIGTDFTKYGLRVSSSSTDNSRIGLRVWQFPQSGVLFLIPCGIDIIIYCYDFSFYFSLLFDIFCPTCCCQLFT